MIKWDSSSSAFLLANLVKLLIVEKIFDRNATLTYFAYFLGCLSLTLTNIKCANNANVGNLWLRSAYIKGFYIMNANTKAIIIKNTCINSSYVDNPKAIKCLEIYSQSFWNLEVENVRLRN